MQRKGKRNKVDFASGAAWTYDMNGNRVAVTSLDQANQIQSECCGLNCCDNTISLPVNDDNGTTVYPSKFEFVKVGSDIKLRLTYDNGTTNIVKEVTLS